MLFRSRAQVSALLGVSLALWGFGAAPVRAAQPVMTDVGNCAKTPPGTSCLFPISLLARGATRGVPINLHGSSSGSLGITGTTAPASPTPTPRVYIRGHRGEATRCAGDCALPMGRYVSATFYNRASRFRSAASDWKQTVYIQIGVPLTTMYVMSCHFSGVVTPPQTDAPACNASNVKPDYDGSRWTRRT